MMDDSMEPTVPYKAQMKIGQIKDSIENGKIYVLKKDNELLVRRVYINNDSIYIAGE